VTRSGEFLPIGQLFTGGCLLESDGSSPKIWSTFFHVKSAGLVLTKNARLFQQLIWPHWLLVKRMIENWAD
jgi:hypothetical protein